jgi:hypothetical protein
MTFKRGPTYWYKFAWRIKQANGTRTQDRATMNRAASNDTVSKVIEGWALTLMGYCQRSRLGQSCLTHLVCRLPSRLLIA